MTRAVARLNGYWLVVGVVLVASSCELIAGLEDRGVAQGDGGGMHTGSTGGATTGGGPTGGDPTGGDPTGGALAGVGAGPLGGGGIFDPHEVPISGVGNVQRGWWHDGAFHLLNAGQKKVYVLVPEMPTMPTDFEIDPAIMSLAPRSFGVNWPEYFVVDQMSDMLHRLGFDGFIDESSDLVDNSLWTLVSAGNDVLIGRDSLLTLYWQPGGPAPAPLSPPMDSAMAITSNGSLFALIGTNSNFIHLFQGPNVVKNDCPKGDVHALLRSISVAGSDPMTAKVVYIGGNPQGSSDFRLRVVSGDPCVVQEVTIGFPAGAMDNLKAAGINDEFIVASTTLNELRVYDAADLQLLGMTTVAPLFNAAQEVVMGPTHAMIIGQTAFPPVMIAFYTEPR